MSLGQSDIGSVAAATSFAEVVYALPAGREKTAIFYTFSKALAPCAKCACKYMLGTRRAEHTKAVPVPFLRALCVHK